MNKLSLVMRKLVVGVGMILLVGVASAQPVTYQFFGATGFGEPHGPILAGELRLDLNADCEVSNLLPGESAWQLVYLSDNNIISGSFGEWSFSGIAQITVVDRPEFWSNGRENIAPDLWVLRAGINGPLFGELTPVSISLFYYTSPAGITSPSLTIPYDPLMSPNAYDFQFNIEFLDLAGESQLVSGQLFTIQSVPEPTVGSLVLVGLGMLALARRRMRRH